MGTQSQAQLEPTTLRRLDYDDAIVDEEGYEVAAPAGGRPMDQQVRTDEGPQANSGLEEDRL